MPGEDKTGNHLLIVRGPSDHRNDGLRCARGAGREDDHVDGEDETADRED